MAKETKAKPSETETNNPKDFINPFAAGVTYKDFLTALGDKTVKEYLSGKEKEAGVLFDEHDFEWLDNEILAHTNK